MILDQKLLKKFVSLAGDRLSGDWVLVGGTVLPYLGVDHRSTTDIDFVGLGPKERAQQLEVMKIAERLGLPVETINSAADFFVHKFMRTKKDLVLLYQGASASIYRPSSVLFFRLKLSRLSESDAEDCVAWLKHVGVTKREAGELSRLIKKAILTASEPRRLEALKKILAQLKSGPKSRLNAD